MDERMNARAEALYTLLDIERNGKLSHIAVSDTLARHQFADKQDRAFYTRLCEGVMEERIYLDYILDHYSKKPMSSCKPLIRNLLRLSVYQILFLSVPDHAAVSEAVKLARKKGFQSLSGFVNGVLRTVVRNKEDLPLPDRAEDETFYLSVRYSMPEWIVDLFLGQYGPEVTEKILEAFLEQRPLTIRTNQSKISPHELAALFAKEGIRAEKGRIVDGAFYLSGINFLEGYKSFRDGFYIVQDESSMIPVLAADLSEGDTVLDLCAAPGGKALHAADRLSGRGLVIARDLSPQKTDLIRENAERTGLAGIRVEEWDAAVPDENLYEKADLVLADLPCSGLGIMGRKNDIKYKSSRNKLTDLVSLQRTILKEAHRYVKPGGQLIYSTCTLNRGENEENVRWLLSHSPLVLESFEHKLPPLLQGRGAKEGMLTLIPGQVLTDGFFVAKFRKPEGR